MTSIWTDMHSGSKKRANLKHDIYWIKEEQRSRCGLRINVTLSNSEFISEVKMKNIDFIKKTLPGNSDVAWVLLLKENTEHDLFEKLCLDLINEADSVDSQETMITIVMNRLKRWQKLLSKNLERQFPLETQMGLFSELHFMRTIVIPKVGVENAIKSWVGPDYDLQDFIFTDAVIEVKSYLSSKSDAVTISRPQQLFSPKNNIYLAAIALSKHSEGESLSTLIENIENTINTSSAQDIRAIFEEKILSYGYNELLHKDLLLNFKVDKTSAFLVDNEFPRIDPTTLPNEILNLKFQIDLTKCSKYLLNMDSIEMEG